MRLPWDLMVAGALTGSGLIAFAMAGEPVDESKVVAADNRFGFKLYAEILKEKAGKNVLVSPSSVTMALAMPYNGAAGATKDAMARTLELSGLSLDEVNRAYGELRRTLENPDPLVQIRIANSLWARKGLSLEPAFVRRNAESYGAETTELDFRDPGAAGRINDWVSRSTNGKIPKIVDRIGADSVLFLIDAIYFKGKWAAEFDKAQTRDEPFHRAAGDKKHPTMHREGKYPYFETPELQAIRLPYGSGRIGMVVLLPAAGSSLAKLHQSLTPARWEEWRTSFVATQGTLALPRFQVEFEVELNDALTALGMGIAFDRSRASFRNMVAGSVAIDRVKHKTYAEVNEEGTEAAAATSVGMVLTSAVKGREPFRMIVDRPFFWAIEDERTGAVLFLGSVLDPQ
jgi:serpin B